MKRNAIVAIALAAMVASWSLTSCTWKKKAEPEGNAGKSGMESTSGPDYRSWATVVEEVGETWSGQTERVTVSSGTGTGLGEAINSEKIQDCDKFGTEADKVACRDIIHFKTGTENHDYAACDKISRPRNRQACESRVTKYLFDFGDCQKIRDETKRDECSGKWASVETAMAAKASEARKKTQETLAKTSNGGTAESRVNQACAQLSGTNRNYCYSVKVSEEIQKGAPTSLCSVIPDAQTKTACEQKASGTTNKSILDQAIAAKNPGLCDKIALQTDKDLCKKIVASWK